MALLLHILIAFSSLIVATALLLAPSQSRLYTSYALIVATIASGTLLVVLNPTHLIQACISGLLYATVVTYGTVVAHRKLANEE